MENVSSPPPPSTIKFPQHPPLILNISALPSPAHSFQITQHSFTFWEGKCPLIVHLPLSQLIAIGAIPISPIEGGGGTMRQKQKATKEGGEYNGRDDPIMVQIMPQVKHQIGPIFSSEMPLSTIGIHFGGFPLFWAPFKFEVIAICPLALSLAFDHFLPINLMARLFI
jgi:hypothetical protein